MRQSQARIRKLEERLCQKMPQRILVHYHHSDKAEENRMDCPACKAMSEDEWQEFIGEETGDPEARPLRHEDVIHLVVKYTDKGTDEETRAWQMPRR